MIHFKSFFVHVRNSLAVQRLELCTSTEGGPGLIPGQGTRIPQVAWSKKKNVYDERHTLKFNFFVCGYPIVVATLV